MIVLGGSNIQVCNIHIQFVWNYLRHCLSRGGGISNTGNREEGRIERVSDDLVHSCDEAILDVVSILNAEVYMLVKLPSCWVLDWTHTTLRDELTVVDRSDPSTLILSSKMTL